MIPIQCTTCGEPSQVDEAWLGQWVACPHCRRPTLAAAAEPHETISAPPPPPPSSPPENQANASAQARPAAPAPPEPAAPAKPRRPLTRDERLAIRRRRHLILAITGAIILLGTAYALSLIGN